MLVAPTAPSPLWIDEDMTVRLRNISVNGTKVADATVTWIVRDKNLTLVPGSAGTASPIVGETGGYKGTIPSTITGLLTKKETYYVDVTIVQNVVNNGFRRLKCIADYRGGS